MAEPTPQTQAPPPPSSWEGLKVELTDHEFHAFLEIPCDFQGTVADVDAFLKSHHIVYGIKPKAIENGIALTQQTHQSQRFLVAEGKEPEEALDGRLDLKFTMGRHADAPDANKTVNMRETGRIVAAKAQQVLAEFTPPQDGMNGINVQDKVIFPQKKRGLKPPLTVGRNVKAEDNKLIALCDGMIEYNGRMIEVSSDFHVKGDVDYSVGNIRFSGPVQIQGSVRPGFMIDAGGAITVQDTVLNATLLSGAEITVTQGVVGEGKSLIKAKGDIKVGFAENSALESHGSIHIRHFAVNCHLTADGVIHALGGKGQIIGGDTRSAHGIEIRVAGSESGTRTVLALGGGIEKENELRNVSEHLGSARDNMQKIQLALGEGLFAKILQDPEYLKQLIQKTKRPILQKLVDEYHKIDATVKVMEEHKTALTTEILEAQKGSIRIAHTTYPGTLIVIGDLSLDITAPFSRPITFFANFKDRMIRTQ